MQWLIKIDDTDIKRINIYVRNKKKVKQILKIWFRTSYRSHTCN